MPKKDDPAGSTTTIYVSRAAAKAGEKWAGKFGMSQRVFMDRLVEWFAKQPDGIKLHVMAITEAETERDLIELLLKKVAKATEMLPLPPNLMADLRHLAGDQSVADYLASHIKLNGGRADEVSAKPPQPRRTAARVRSLDTVAEPQR